MEYKNLTFFLASSLSMHDEDEFGNKFPKAIENENQIFENIKKNLTDTKLCLSICNDPTDYERNDYKLKNVEESFALSNLNFNQYILIDNRNIEIAPLVIKKANLILLMGGKIICQNDFLQKIKFKERLKFSNAVVIGVSAGAMNLCKGVFNFPEEISEINEQKEVKGLGFFDKYLIPHFDGDNMIYQIPTEINIVKEYILPFSNKNSLLGLPNGSYIMIKDKNYKIYGTSYLIENNQVKKEMNDSILEI